jgi:hypothetical protein
VAVRVDETRHYDHARGIHDLRIGRIDISADCGDRRALNQYIGAAYISKRSVEGKYMAALDQNPAAALRRDGISGEGELGNSDAGQRDSCYAREYGATVETHAVQTVYAAGAIHEDLPDFKDGPMPLCGLDEINAMV